MGHHEVRLAWGTTLDALSRVLGHGDASEVVGQALLLARLNRPPETGSELWRVASILAEDPYKPVSDIGQVLKAHAIFLSSMP